ncbi:MAG: NAD(P)-dependent oxidoreductase [Candidatus Micrarchaeota archaeon]|nr:NAD(P)-dependent oxidoreductase [Candidatus Micrarchaeota archaeon]
MKVAITGASGRLAQYFKEVFPDAIPITRANNSYETEDLRRAIKDVDYVIHLAGKIYGKDVYKVNVELAENLYHALEHQKLFFASSIAVYGRRDLTNADENTPPMPNDDYGRGKLKAEEILREHKPHIIARIGTLYGEHYPEYIKMIKLWKLWPFYFSNNHVPFTYARDVARFALLDVQGTYVLSSPGYPFLEVVNAVREVFSIKKPPIKLPKLLAHLMLGEKAKPLLLDRTFNPAKALKAGWRITPFKEGIRCFLTKL